MQSLRPLHACLLLLTAASLLPGCASHSLYAGESPKPARDATWSVTPLVNDTEAPYAGDRAQQIVAALLAGHGVDDVRLPPASEDTGAPLPIDRGERRRDRAAEWARGHEVRYLLTGSVQEWQYKIGLDGQPAVGITLRLVDLDSDEVIWTGTAAASGGSREAVAALAQRTADRLIGRLLP